jgi:hypothetical protein
MARRHAAPRSRRAPAEAKRTSRVAVRFTPAQLAEVDAAAARDGLLTAAWLGNVGLAQADPCASRTDDHASREELDKLAQATEKVRRAGVLLNQVVKTMHATGQVRPVIEHIAVKVWQAVEELDDATMAIAARRNARRHR